jgi:hypothetical protein
MPAQWSFLYNGSTLENEARRGGKRIAMKICACGNVAEKSGDRCARCNALQVLELKAGASNEEIQNAFDAQGQAWAPERFQENTPMRAMAEKKFQAIEDAYSLLIRSSLQAAPYRSEAEGERVEVPMDIAPGEESQRRGRKKRQLGYSQAPARRPRLSVPLLIGCGVVATCVVVAWMLFKPLEARLMSTPGAGKVYAEYKTGVRSSIQELKDKMSGVAGSNTPAPNPGGAASNPAQGRPSQEGKVATSGARRPATQQPGAARTAKIRVLPVITAGLSKSEVIGVLGAPTSATEDKLVFGNSEFTFRNDSLVGWKIDSVSSIRVKLWPDAMVDPGVHSFGIGSSKDVVIAVQGTPSLFSENVFGYGGSRVYFLNNRVTNLKSDPSAPLRTATR